MILIALGANLPSDFGTPEETLCVAQARLVARGVDVVKASRVWLTAPVPVSDQPWYRNAVVAVETDLSMGALMALLHEIEAEFGRVRGEKNAPRVLDLDLIAYDEQVSTDERCAVPHPRMHQRAFVLMPLAEIAPEWRHPVLGRDVLDLIENLPEGKDIEVLDEQLISATK